MNIRKSLLEPSVQLKPEAEKIAAYAASSANRFDALMQCFLSNEYRLQQRASWCVSLAVQNNNKHIEPYIGTLVQQLSRKDVPNAIYRNSLRILQYIEVPQTYTGELINACFNFVETPGTPVAIKAFALTVLGNLAVSVPEIKPEIKLVIEFKIGYESAAFKVRAREVLKKLYS